MLQGSILGPLLFIIYVNDISASVNGEITQFADDTSVVIYNKLKDDMTKNINTNMNELTHWFKNNNLTLNTNKTKFIFFTTKHMENDINIHPSVDSTKFLGLFIDSNLKWESHVDNLSKKLTGINYMLYSLRTYVDRNVLLTAYFGIFQSKMAYGIPFWGGYDSKLKRIFTLQKRAIRTIFFLGPCDSCRLFFKSERILTAPGVYVLQIAELVKNGTIKTAPRLHEYETRGKSLVQTSSFKLKLFENNIDNRGPKIFNNLPSEIKTISNPKKFKIKLKKWLLHHTFYSLEEFFGHTEQG